MAGKKKKKTWKRTPEKIIPKIKEDRVFNKKISERQLGNRPENEEVILEQSINEIVKGLEELTIQAEEAYAYSVNKNKDRQFDTEEKQRSIENCPIIKQKD